YAGRSLVVSNCHGFCAKISMLKKRLVRHVVDHSCRFCQEFRKILRRMLLPLAVHNPPLQFEVGGTIDIKRLVADCRNGAIKYLQIRQGLFIVVSSASFLEYEKL